MVNEVLSRFLWLKYKQWQQGIDHKGLFYEEVSCLIRACSYTSAVLSCALDAIRQERNFQMSGEVDDDFVASIDHCLGADIVLTGSISGEGEMRRLRFRALDVKTAQVLAMCL